MEGFLERWRRAFLPVYPDPSLVLVEGKGTRVRDCEGREYLDFFGGIAVLSTGYSHPRIVEAVRRQSERLLHVSNYYGTWESLDLAEKLLRKTGYDRVFLANSGAEANECALKLARRRSTRLGLPPRILALEGSFHGRTLGTVSLTGQPKYRRDFGPLLPEVEFVKPNDTDALRRASEGGFSAIFLEFVQGEGGVVPLERSFVEEAWRISRRVGALLVADEVQTGVGRTGRFLAGEHYGILPDITTLAKGLASGFPIGAVLVEEEVSSFFSPSDHGSTFGGGPLASAVACATLDVVESEGLVERAERMGSLLRQRLEEEVGGRVVEVRGLGLLLGIVLKEGNAREIVSRSRKMGLLVGSAGESVVRLAPPLVVREEEIEEAVGILSEAIP